MRLRVLACIVLLALSLYGVATVVQAHAEYVTSEPHANGILPTAPTGVSITLSEAAQAGTASIRVTDVNGTRVDLGPVNRSASDPRTFSVGLAPIAPGVYTVTWSAVSAVDGHFTAGSFAFAVQDSKGNFPPLPGATSGSQPISLAEIAARGLTFAGLAIALGAVILAGFLWIPAGEETGLSDRPSFGWGYRALLQWAWVGAVLVVVGTSALWVNALIRLPPADPGGLVGSAFLAATAARLSLAIALFIVLWVASRRAARALSGVRPVELLVAAGLGVAAIIAGSAGTHAAAASWGLAGPLADSIHLIGVSLWVGGLLGLLRIRPWLREPDLRPVAAEVFAVFSELAGWAVALVLGAGVVLSLILVGTLDALVGTTYGWIVLAKISLFAPMLAIGAWNRYRVLPATGDPATLPVGVSTLARNVRFEAVLGAVVLALAAVLTTISPAASTNPGDASYRLVASSDGIVFDLQIFPFPSVPAPYTFVLFLYNQTNGAEYNDATNATLRFTLLNSGIPRQDIPMTQVHGYHFYIDQSPVLSKPGYWKIEALVSRTTGLDVTATFNVPVGIPG